MDYIEKREGRVVRHDRMKVLDAKFVAKLGDESFKLETLNLPKGRRVIVDSVGSFLWTGKELRMATSSDRLNPDSSIYQLGEKR